MIPPENRDSLPPLRDVIERFNLNARKSLGQNFILDLNLTAKIARLAGDLNGRTVIEIGPGPGGLTRALLAAGAARVVAVERDERCLPALAEVAAHWPDKLQVVAGDALEMNWSERIAASTTTVSDAIAPAGRKPLIIANLPYGIATRLLINWLESTPWPPWYDGMVLMFQKEVAERIVAAPGVKAYGRLSVISQWRCRCDIAMTLGPEAFTPAPKVASAVVVFQPRLALEPACDVKRLGQVSRAIFGQRRKMLRASLKPLWRQPEALLATLDLDPTARGETLAVADIARIAAAIDRYAPST